MTVGAWQTRLDTFSTLGTVLQQTPGCSGVGSQLSLIERKLLAGALEAGLTAPDFFAVRRIADLAAWPSPALLVILLCEQLATMEGSTYLDLQEEALQTRLNALGLAPSAQASVLQKRATLEKEGGPLIDVDPDQSTPFILAGTRLYRHSHYHGEQRLRELLLDRLPRPWLHPPQLRNAYAQVVGRGAGGSSASSERIAFKLSTEQSLAALVAMCAPLTVIAGGPGTGKTSIVLTILLLLRELNVSWSTVVLAAPTGRAANRLRESLQHGSAAMGENVAIAEFELLDPMTLHRLLGWSPAKREYHHHQGRPLGFDWVVVDESSMIDLAMMEQLFSALKPTAHLILLGDENQLPSVETGAVFRDLSHSSRQEGAAEDEDPWALLALREPENSPDRHVVHLRKSFRQKDNPGGRHIVKIAESVKRGRDVLKGEPGPAITLLEHAGDLPWEGVSLLEPEKCSLRDLIDQLFGQFFAANLALAQSPLLSLEHDHERLETLFSGLDQVRTLCLMHRSPFGVGMVNQWFLEKYLKGEGSLRAGVPFMVTRNDYRQDLFNGDIVLGLDFIEQGQKKRWLVVRGAQGFRRVAPDQLQGLVPGFAMTVHKSQGSECEHVVLVLPDSGHALGKREVIYTALTRAKRSVLIYGSPAVLQQAVAAKLNRVTGLQMPFSHGQEAE